MFQETGDLLQSRGGEYGVTTKRKRRCGWLDIPMLRYTYMVNGYTALCLTKLDILDTLSEIKIAVSYNLNGKIINHFPSSSTEVASVIVEYITLPGWKQSTESVRDYNDLPENAKKYIEKIEELVDVPGKL